MSEVREGRDFGRQQRAWKFGSRGKVGASLVAQLLKSLSVHETQVQSLGREDPLEKERAAHSSILAWEIPWTEEPGWLQSMGLQKSQRRLSD